MLFCLSSDCSSFPSPSSDNSILSACLPACLLLDEPLNISPTVHYSKPFWRISSPITHTHTHTGVHCANVSLFSLFFSSFSLTLGKQYPTGRTLGSHHHYQTENKVYYEARTLERERERRRVTLCSSVVAHLLSSLTQLKPFCPPLLPPTLIDSDYSTNWLMFTFTAPTMMIAFQKNPFLNGYFRRRQRRCPASRRSAVADN